VLLVSGLAVWEDHFGASTSILTQRKAILVHSLAAVLSITVIIFHVYAGIWIKGTMQGMLHGSVTGGWAWLHHRKWLVETLGRKADVPPMEYDGPDVPRE
jgi:formate dehydrogenase subunit gamma